MNTLIKSNEELTSSEKQNIADFLPFCFDDWDQAKYELVNIAPTYRHLFIYDQDKLVSYLRIIIREAQFNGRNIRIGGIGDVATHPEYRGKGYSTELVKKGMVL